ncbi:hypothetical protein [Streptomyces sp. NBC_00691]|uniref:hypothetical protein n=1 Tax=Streptomyces sp. NBC_00691 TaxID=2903671 RepID=UPI002E2EF839|nr:hypothetical protein [Streptomyces sp. NBC_00691]
MSVRTSAALRVTLLLLALVCGTFVLPAPSGPSPLAEQSRAQQAAAPAFADAGDGKADASQGSVLHRDRRRSGTAAAGPPGPPPLVTRTAHLTDRPAGRAGGPARTRPFARHDSSALQVFLC